MPTFPAHPARRSQHEDVSMKTSRSTVIAVLVLAALAVVAGFLVGSPLVGVLLAAAIGAIYGLFRMLRRGQKAAGSNPSSDASEAMDPFTLGEPWRDFVSDALRAQRRFRDTVAHTNPGPIRDRLSDIGERLDHGVSQVWATARQGQNLRKARRNIDTTVVEQRLAEARAAVIEAAKDPLAPDDTANRTVQSLESQLASAERLQDVTVQAEGKLKLLQAQLDEAVARAAELSAQVADPSALTSLGDDVDQLVDSMEALRRALEETSAKGTGAV